MTWALTRPEPTSPLPVRRISINLPSRYPVAVPAPFAPDASLALSPDGSMLVYVTDSGDSTILVKRPLATPEVEAMRSEFPVEEFQIIAVNLDQKTKKALRFLSKHSIAYPSASDPKGLLPRRYGVDTMPTSYLIDREGVIRYVHRGFQRGDGSKLRHEIRALLEASR